MRRSAAFNQCHKVPITGRVLTRRTSTTVVAALLLCAGVIGAVASSRASDWHPLPLVVLLVVLAHGSELMTLDMRGVRMSGSFLAFVLAMALLGPAPAVAISLSCAVVDALLTRRSPDRALLNFAMYATYPLAGGLAIVAVAGAAP